MLEGPRQCTISVFVCAHTLCMNYTPNTFLLVSSPVRSKLLCFLQGQGQNININIQQRTLSGLITILLY